MKRPKGGVIGKDRPRPTQGRRNGQQSSVADVTNGLREFALSDKHWQQKKIFLRGRGKRSRRQVEWKMGRGSEKFAISLFSHIVIESTHLTGQNSLEPSS